VLVGEVAEAEGLGDLSWGEEFLELQGRGGFRRRKGSGDGEDGRLVGRSSPWRVCLELGRGCACPR
jgi:hypothetical protein